MAGATKPLIVARNIVGPWAHQHHHSVRRAAAGALARRCRRRRPASGRHRAWTDARPDQGPGLRRSARAGQRARHRRAAVCRRPQGRACRPTRCILTRPGGLTLSDAAAPQQAEATARALTFDSKRWNDRPRGRIRQAAVRTGPRRRRGAVHQPHRRAARSRALLSGAPDVRRGQGRARHRDRRRAPDRRRSVAARAARRRQHHAGPPRRGAEGPRQSGGRQSERRAAVARAAPSPARQMGGGASTPSAPSKARSARCRSSCSGWR